MHGLLSHPGSPEALSLLTSAADISRDDNGHTASWLIATALCGTGDDGGTHAQGKGTTAESLFIENVGKNIL